MKRATHNAFWKTWKAKTSAAVVIVIAMVPQLAPPELAAWFHEQFPGLPSWASWGIAVLIGLARYRAAAATPGEAEE